jgi:excisionase family DNA binding protein
MKDFGEMVFYSTAELAEKLRMNIQVIARKLQSGEIEGYKVGKDWRVEEDAVQRWLDNISNQHTMTVRQKVLGNFFKDGRLTHLPTTRNMRTYILEFFLEKFELNRKYAEAEVNQIISQYYEDFCTVRREFIANKMMVRSEGYYRRASSYKFSE